MFLLDRTQFKIVKLKSYARNYNMNSQTKKYFNLDFAYLVELSKLDMYIRKIILEIIFLETNKSKKLILQGLQRVWKVVGCVGFQIVYNMMRIGHLQRNLEMSFLIRLNLVNCIYKLFNIKVDIYFLS